MRALAAAILLTMLPCHPGRVSYHTLAAVPA